MNKIFLSLLLPVLVFANPINGYVDHWGNQVPGIITNETWMSPQPVYTSGKMVFYGPYAMDATAEFRGIDYEKEGCIGGVALMSPYNIGDKVWIKVNDKWYGSFCVVDCARRGDMYSIVVHREEVVEVNFEFAVEIGMVSEHVHGEYEVYEWFLPAEVLIGYDPVTFSFEYGDVSPVNYKSYFLKTYELAEVLPRWIITLEEGMLWKEYGNDLYWDKSHPFDKE